MAATAFVVAAPIAGHGLLEAPIPGSRARGKDPGRLPNALATMWTWISEHARDADRVLREVLAPMLKRDPDPLSDQLCLGPAAHCAELLSRYAQAGCQRVYLWPLGIPLQRWASFAVCSRSVHACAPWLSNGHGDPFPAP